MTIPSQRVNDPTRLRRDESLDAVRAWALDHAHPVDQTTPPTAALLLAYRLAHGTARKRERGALPA